MKKPVQPKVEGEPLYQPIFDFYRPHARVRYTGELVNHHTGEVFTPPRMVKQSFRDECDVNKILKQFGPAGLQKRILESQRQGQYLDLPDDLDYQTSLDVIRRGEQAFDSLPAKVRERFANDPAEFLEFMADPKNAQEMIDLGLATRSPAAAPPAPVAPKEPQAPTPPAEPPKAPEGS